MIYIIVFIFIYLIVYDIFKVIFFRDVTVAKLVELEVAGWMVEWEVVVELVELEVVGGMAEWEVVAEMGCKIREN